MNTPDRKQFPQIKSRIDFNYAPSVQVEWMHVGLYEVTIKWSEIDFFLKHPDELIRQLKQADTLLKNHGEIDGFNMWRCNHNTFRVYRGLHYPLTDGTWEHGALDNYAKSVVEL